MRKLLILAGLIVCISHIQAENIVLATDTIIKTTSTVTETDPQTGKITTTVTETERTIPVSVDPASSVQYGGSSYSFLFSWKKRKSLSSHWTGFGMGFMNYDDKKIPNGSLKMSTSHNFTMNLFGYHKQISHSNWLLVSGVGSEWSRYHFSDNVALTKVDGITTFVPASDGLKYNDTKLLTYYVTFPLLLEYQQSDFHISGGVVGFLKFYSQSEVNYYVDGNKIEKGQGKDLNIRPVDLRARLQIGMKGIYAYGYYAPFSMFEKGKGPDMKTYTIGVIIGI